jgi:hypothetical protein
MKVDGRSRTLGFFVGLTKGISYVVAAYLLGELAVPPSDWPRQWQEAGSLSVVYHVVNGACGVLPDNMCPRIMPPPTAGPTILYSRPRRNN